MFLTGFADEASRDLKEQIRATEELGWKFIETRFIGNKNLGTISDAEFEDVLEILSQTDVRFNCYGATLPTGANRRVPTRISKPAGRSSLPPFRVCTNSVSKWSAA